MTYFSSIQLCAYKYRILLFCSYVAMESAVRKERWQAFAKPDGNARPLKHAGLLMEEDVREVQLERKERCRKNARAFFSGRYRRIYSLPLPIR